MFLQQNRTLLAAKRLLRTPTNQVYSDQCRPQFLVRMREFKNCRCPAPDGSSKEKDRSIMVPLHSDTLGTANS